MIFLIADFVLQIYCIHYVYNLHQHDVLVFRSMWIRISTISTQPCQKEGYFYPPIY